MLFNILTVASRDLLISIMNFGISSILARSLDKDVLGIWFALQTLFLIGDSIFRYRSDVVMVLRYKSGENSKALGTQFLIAAATSLVVLMICLIFSAKIFEFFNSIVPNSNVLAVNIVLISLSASIFATTYIYFLTAKKAFKKYNWVLVSQTVANFSVVGVGVFFGFTGLMTPVVAQLVAWVVVLPLALRTLYLVSKDFSWSEAGALGKEGFHFQVNSVVATLQFQIPRLFSLYFLAIEDLAEIGLLFVLILLMLKFPAAINTVFFAETKSSLDLKSYRPIFGKLLVVIISVYSVAFLVSPTVIGLAFGSLYVDIAYTFRAILVFSLLHSIAIIVLGLRNMIGDFRSMNICVCVGAFIQCLFLFFAARSMDSAIASYAVFSVVFFLLSCFLARSTLREVLY